MAKPKLAVIGASHFQLPLIQKAQDMGCEVHAFAWECGDVGESAADVFHPVSIVEVDSIVRECRRIGVDGVCTIASDLATVAVNHVADALGLVGNTLECTRVSTDKSLMRRAFALAGDPSPQNVLVRLDEGEGGEAVGVGAAGAADGAAGGAAAAGAADGAAGGAAGAADGAADAAAANALAGGVVVRADQLDAFDPEAHGLAYPVIVKPVDRSGSRGVTKLDGPGSPMGVGDALRQAFEQGFARCALVEEFAEGDEFSVEGLSWHGAHTILTITRKATTGAPHFIEVAHAQPAGLDPALAERVRSVVVHALDTLGVRFGASHSELKIAPDGTIRIIEIGARMGGDCIGSHLVPLSTGIDFVRAVVDVALGRKPDLAPQGAPQVAAIRFLFDGDDMRLLERVRSERPQILQSVRLDQEALGGDHVVTDSSTRLGHFIMAATDAGLIAPYLPDGMLRGAPGNPAGQ